MMIKKGCIVLELIQKIKDCTEAGIILEHMELFDELLDYPELQVPYTDKELIDMNIYKCEIGHTCYIQGYGCVRENHDMLKEYFEDSAKIFLYKCHTDMTYKLAVSDKRKCYFHVCEYENIKYCAQEISNKVYSREE